METEEALRQKAVLQRQKTPTDKDKNQLRQNERDNDKFMERQQHTVGPPVTETEEALRQKAEVYRRDFIEEHRKRGDAEAKAKELEAKLEAIQEKEHEYEEELENLREELEQTREEKDNILRMKRSLKRELDLAKEQEKYLQARLRDLERERRIERNQPGAMYNAPLAPSPWACPLCTFDNNPSASKCEICEEPRPDASKEEDNAKRLLGKGGKDREDLELRYVDDLKVAAFLPQVLWQKEAFFLNIEGNGYPRKMRNHAVGEAGTTSSILSNLDEW